MVEVTRSGDRIRVLACGYRLEADQRYPKVALRDDAGELTVLSLAASAGDLSWSPVVAFDGPVVTCTWSSSVWARKVVRVECGEDELTVTLELAPGEEARQLYDVTLLGGDAVLPTGAAGTFRSAIRHPVLFSPNPSEPVAALRPSSAAASAGVVGDNEPGRLHGIFSPAPFAFGLGRGVEPSATGLHHGDWLGVWLRAGIEACTFTQLTYEPLDGGFLLRLAYEGHTAVRGPWTSPAFVIRPGFTDPLDIVRAASEPAISTPRASVPDWHLQPIFCGWGAQCARSRTVSDQPPNELLGGTTAATAPSLARQELYDEWLALLESAGIDPGTVVVDDRWQAAYGLHTVDADKWPDLKGWVAEQHARGRRVLLWWKAWDPEGLPDEECVRTPDGTRVSCDPTSPAYRERVRATVTHLLGTGGIDADGFKTDFTQRCPSGPGLLRHEPEGPWGVAGLHLLLRTIHEAAHAVKPDALVVTHTPNYLFRDVTDMVRLNDVTERDLSGALVPPDSQLRFRASVAAAALPGVPLDTDQWPMPDKAGWLAYTRAQPLFGVPALYYAESIDASGEVICADDLAVVRDSWATYREAQRG